MVPSAEAFRAWFADAVGGTPTKAEEACFQAGYEYAVRVGSQATRAGSLVRGRVVLALRCLDGNELARENGALDRDTVWPCLELDDGSVVYAARKLRDGSYGPAILGGQAEVNGVVKRLTHTAKVIGAVNSEGGA